jgi:hypothetical protein
MLGKKQLGLSLDREQYVSVADVSDDDVLGEGGGGGGGAESDEMQCPISFTGRHAKADEVSINSVAICVGRIFCRFLLFTRVRFGSAMYIVGVYLWFGVRERMVGR